MKFFEDVTPNPEYLIKSIAEQGYSLESALADLIDNSLSANANQVEILIKTDKEPFILYLTDNFKKGETVILNENKKIIKKIKPQKYKFVTFGNNYHYNYFPVNGRRIVLIATYR